MEKLLEILKFFDIECKEVERSGEFLGLIAGTEGVKLAPSFIEKALRQKKSFFESPDSSLKEFMIMFGHVIWANITIMKRPLCFLPECLNTLRKAALSPDEKLTPTIMETIRKELEFFDKDVQKARAYNPQVKTTVAWSDATPFTGAVVIEESTSHDLFARCTFSKEVPIFLGELAMAVWAGLNCPDAPHHVVDNTAAGYAIAKGHSTSRAANAMLRLLFTYNPPHKISWVESEQERADKPSRGDIPPHRKDSYSSQKILKSFFTIQGEGGGFHTHTHTEASRLININSILLLVVSGCIIYFYLSFLCSC